MKIKEKEIRKFSVSKITFTRIKFVAFAVLMLIDWIIRSKGLDLVPRGPPSEGEGKSACCSEVHVNYSKATERHSRLLLW